MVKRAPKNPVHLHRSDWASDPNLWRGLVESGQIGASVTIIFYSTEEIGTGPTWHVHPYDEIFIVQKGRALFSIGDRKIEAKAGDILMGPAAMPHKYKNLGPGLLQTTDIHLSPEWIQSDLYDPEVGG